VVREELAASDLSRRIEALRGEMAAHPEDAAELEAAFLETLRLNVPHRVEEVVQMLAEPVIQLIDSNATRQEIQAHLRERPIGQEARRLAFHYALKRGSIGRAFAVMPDLRDVSVDQPPSTLPGQLLFFLMLAIAIYSRFC
jgi:hypothetical protein